MLRDLATESKLPWCVIGDFNDMMFETEKRGGRRHPYNLLMEFTEVLNECGLHDLGFVGEKFTWERGRGQQHWVQERLDRGVTTQSWRDIFPLAEVQTIEVSTSGHLPLYPNLMKQVYVPRGKIFRKKNNNIDRIKDVNGEWQESKEEIRGVIENYFEELFTSSNTPDQLSSGERVTQITKRVNEELLQEVHEDEVKEAVFAMHPDKACGPEGLNPDFFQVFWDIVKHDVINFCRRFIQLGELPSEVNEIVICLIPKVKAPTVEDTSHVLFTCNAARELWCELGEHSLLRVGGGESVREVLKRNVWVWERTFIPVFGVHSMVTNLLQDWRKSQDVAGVAGAGAAGGRLGKQINTAEETDEVLGIPEKIDFEDSDTESEQKEPVIMGDRIVQADAALMDFSRPKIDDIQSSILHPTIQANTFEIKPGTIQMVQNSVSFGGAATEHPNMYIRNFVEICSTFKYNGVTDEAIKLRLFPFSLRDKANDRLHSEPAGSITTWQDLAQKFLVKFYPMAKTAAVRSALTQFTQQPTESMCEAWERYKEMLRKCQHHGMPDWMVITSFYNGLGAQSRPMLDAAAGGALWAKSYTGAYNLIETMAANEHQNLTQRMMPGKVAGILEVDAATAITAQLLTLSMKVDALATYRVNQIAMVCELCAGSHATDQCSLVNEFVQSGKVADAEKAKDGEAEVGDEEDKQKEKAAEPRKTTVEHTLPEVEDVLVKVDELFFPADFIILDFEEDKKILIILGRPFLATGRTLIDVQKGELTMRVQDQDVTFNIFKAIKFPTEDEECLKVDLINSAVTSELDHMLMSDALEKALVGDFDSDDEDGNEQLQYLNASPWRRKLDMPFESLGTSNLKNAEGKLKPSIEEAPTLEIKPFPEHLSEEDKLLRILREFKSAIAWTIADIKGISPSYCMHKILLEEGSKPTVEQQHRLNPIMKEVVKKEILKWLDAVII
ncbi:hypothetical protein AgCh_024828 [Apium graveolens]